MSVVRDGRGGAGAGGGATGEGLWALGWARGLCYVGLGLLGVLVGAAGVLVQAAWLPLGLVLGLLGSVGVFWGGSQVTRNKVGAVAPATGWFLAVFGLAMARPEGDLLLGAGVGAYVYLFGGLMCAVICATLALPAPLAPRPKSR
ncbi:DUF6113 family protein [Streptomyces sp. NPDC005438]|uniref:DUF6113 family protein n=1 Tax=Streptomyces sp. NPDC005438 TaxID=3156880 RepID=UPI0033AC82AC